MQRFLRFLLLLNLPLLSLSAFAIEPLFKNGCVHGAGFSSLTIEGVGDILLHSPLQRKAYANMRFEEQDGRQVRVDTDTAIGLRSIWSPVADILSSADITYANLEGPVAPGLSAGGRQFHSLNLERSLLPVFGTGVYTSYPSFNYHSSILGDILRAGIDIVSTANNHSWDRSRAGVNLTASELTEAGLPFIGTRSAQGGQLYQITNSIDRRTNTRWKLAWIACTFSLNQGSTPMENLDPQNQILNCFGEQNQIVDLIHQLNEREDIDAVIITPHWGTAEGSTRVDNTDAYGQNQQALGRSFIDAGAQIVIGTHPHVVRPWEKYETTDGRQGLIVYSTGNFISGQYVLDFRYHIGAMVFAGLTKAISGGKAWVNGFAYVGTEMLRQSIELIALGRDPARAEQDRAGIRFIEAIMGSERRRHPMQGSIPAGATILPNFECFDRSQAQ